MDPQVMVDLAERTRRAVMAKELESALEAITRSAVTYGLCDLAGVVRLTADGGFRATGATAPQARKLDEWQIEVQDGPALEVTLGGNAMVIGQTLAVETRWSGWTPLAAEAGVVEVISARLFAEDVTLGALTLYGTGLRRSTSADLDQIRLIAAHASIALGHFHGSENLWRAIDARHRIGQAQGILMERFTVSTDTALNILRRYSQDQQMKLRLVAEHLIRTGSLPEHGGGGARADGPDDLYEPGDPVVEG